MGYVYVQCVNPSPEHMPRWLRLWEQHPKAERVLAMFGVQEPPVPIYDIARGLDLVVREVSEPGWAGALRVRWEPTPTAHIWIRAEDSEARKRYTLAHEISHLILHVRRDKPETCEYRDISFAGSRVEAQANGYAANLLMPMPWVNSLGTVYGFDANKLASRFRVSPSAMAVRVEKVLGSW